MRTYDVFLKSFGYPESVDSFLEFIEKQFVIGLFAGICLLLEFWGGFELKDWVEKDREGVIVLLLVCGFFGEPLLDFVLGEPLGNWPGPFLLF